MYYVNLFGTIAITTYNTYSDFLDPLKPLGTNFSHFSHIAKRINELESTEKSSEELNWLKRKVRRLTEAYPNLAFQDAEFDFKGIRWIDCEKSPGTLCGMGHLSNGYVVANSKLGFNEVDAEAWAFSIKHECGHIKHGDSLLLKIATSVSYLGTILYTYEGGGLLDYGTWTAIGTSLLIGKITGTFLSRITENRADDFAVANATNEELLGGRRLFIALQQMNKQIHTKGWGGYLWTNSEGSDRTDLCHPPIYKRIAKIEYELSKRNVEIIEEPEKIALLRQRLIETLFIQYPHLERNLNLT